MRTLAIAAIALVMALLAVLFTPRTARALNSLFSSTSWRTVGCGAVLGTRRPAAGRFDASRPPTMVLRADMVCLLVADIVDATD